MGITWTREIPRERSLSGKLNDGEKYTRAFLVRTDSLTESLVNISNAPGISLGDTHPNNSSVQCETFDVKAADDSGLIYRVSFEYAKQKPEDDTPPPDPENPADGPNHGGRLPTWSANSSVTSGPVFKDNANNIITNSAGDPLEGLEKEHAEFRLSKTEYWGTHATWRTRATQFTNTVNDALWNDGDPGTWKCQGCSAKLNIENKDGVNDIYWELTWEFAYRQDGWNLKLWDVGFHELVDESGQPVERGSAPGAGWINQMYIPGGGETHVEGVGPLEYFDNPGGGDAGCPEDARRRAILGQDKKPVKHPVALSKGIAKPPCKEPDELFYEVYDKNNFNDTFGELSTPV